jgi:peptide/nickel transport system permease protein
VSLRKLAERILRLLPVALAVTLLTFLLLELVPGDAATTLLGEQATPAALAALREELGLDRPFLERYFDWLGSALVGDLGSSLATGRPVGQVILERLPVTIELMVLAQIWALALSVPLAVWSAYRKDRTADRVIAGGSFALLAMPGFMTGVVLIWVFSITLGILPSSGYRPFEDGLIANLTAMLLPSLTLGLVEFPVVMRVLRSDLIATLQQDFILLARAQGLSDQRILWGHALRPSLLNAVTIVGLNVGALMGGAVVVETLFAMPGLGQLLIASIYGDDVPVVQGIVLVVASAFVLTNLLVDLSYALLDPRVRPEDHDG